jgi:hypothetical protein
MSKYLIFNDKKFAALGATLEQGMLGFFTKSPKSNNISLYKADGSLEACIVNNFKQGYFVISASVRNGKPFYMHSTCSTTEKWLGIETLSMSDTYDAITNMVLCLMSPAEADAFLDKEYRAYVKNVSEGDPMSMDDWLAGSDIPKVVQARKDAKRV